MLPGSCLSWGPYKRYISLGLIVAPDQPLGDLVRIVFVADVSRKISHGRLAPPPPLLDPGSSPG